MVERYARRAEENGSRCGVCASAWRRFSSGASMTAAVLWIAVGIAACGGSTSAPTPTPSAVMGTAQLAIKVTLTGAVAETGELIQSVVGTTCETFAEGRSHTFLIPSGPANATLAGNPFHLTAPIAQYAGPGDYSLDTEGFGGNQFTTAVTVGPASAPETFKIFLQSEEAATVNDDGSGSFTFLDWVHGIGGLGTENENGMLAWTCRSLPS